MSDWTCFLDTNVLLRHWLSDHEDHSPRATALINAIAQGLQTVQVSDTVVFEAAYTLERWYHVPRSTICELLLEFLSMPGVILPGKTAFGAVFDLYVLNPGLSIADCFHAELALRSTRGSIISFDRKFDRIEGISRIEP